MILSPRKLIQRRMVETSALAMQKGPRASQPGHEKAVRCLTEKLAGFKRTPWPGERFALTSEFPHPNKGQVQKFTNLVVVIPVKDRGLPPLLLGAHCDCVIDAPCADDNATSVALNPTLAEEFAEGELARDLAMALFDAEEPPQFLGSTMGSRPFVEDHCEGLTLAGGIVSDLIGSSADEAVWRVDADHEGGNGCPHRTVI